MFRYLVLAQLSCAGGEALNMLRRLNLTCMYIVGAQLEGCEKAVAVDVAVVVVRQDGCSAKGRCVTVHHLAAIHLTEQLEADGEWVFVSAGICSWQQEGVCTAAHHICPELHRSAERPSQTIDPMAFGGLVVMQQPRCPTRSGVQPPCSTQAVAEQRPPHGDTTNSQGGQLGCVRGTPGTRAAPLPG